MNCINSRFCPRAAQSQCDPERCSDYAPTAAEIDRISKEKTTGAWFRIVPETTTGGGIP
jgi:hypothetical protein